MNTTTITLPAYWASAIINDDWSGLEAKEAVELQDFYVRNPHLGGALGVGEPYIGRHVGKLADVADYVFSVRQERKQDETCAY